MTTKIHIFKDKAGFYRWHAKARNGKIVATSGEAFASKYNAIRAAFNFAAATKFTISVTTN